MRSGVRWTTRWWEGRGCGKQEVGRAVHLSPRERSCRWSTSPPGVAAAVGPPLPRKRPEGPPRGRRARPVVQGLVWRVREEPTGLGPRPDGASHPAPPRGTRAISFACDHSGVGEYGVGEGAIRGPPAAQTGPHHHRLRKAPSSSGGWKPVARAYGLISPCSTSRRTYSSPDMGQSMSLRTSSLRGRRNCFCTLLSRTSP